MPTAQPDKVEMDPENVKLSNSKLKVWDFAKISPSEFQSLTINHFFYKVTM